MLVLLASFLSRTSPERRRRDHSTHCCRSGLVGETTNNPVRVRPVRIGRDRRRSWTDTAPSCSPGSKPVSGDDAVSRFP
jgi:hypothetical protein